MTEEQLRSLLPGQIVRHKHSSDAYMVHANYGSYAIAVRIHHVSNPIEWDIVDEVGRVIEGKTAARRQGREA